MRADARALAGVESTGDAARQRADRAVTSGKAAEVFSRMVAALGGPADFIERTDHHLPSAPMTLPVPSLHDGYLAAVDARALGNAIIELGGGRRRADDKLDLSVGFTDIAVHRFRGRPWAAAGRSSCGDRRGCAARDPQPARRAR